MWIKHWMRAVWCFGDISSRASSWRGFKFQTKIRTFTVNSKSATDIFCIVFHFQVVTTDWWLSLTYGGWKRSVWDLWFFPLDTTWSSPLLIGYSISWTKPATIVKPASASTGQIPLLKRSCPNLNSFLQSWSDCCCFFSAVHSFATLLEASHQVILKAFACSPLQSHGQACLCDILSIYWQMGSPKQLFWKTAREQDGKYMGFNSAGQVLRMTDVLSRAALCCRRRQALSCGFWLRAYSAIRKPLTSLKWGSECVSLPSLFKQLLLEAMPYSPKGSLAILYLYLSQTLYRMWLLLL